MLKVYITSLLILLGAGAVYAQQDTAMSAPVPYAAYQRNTTLLTVSFGLSDWNKANYKKPDSSHYTSGTASLPLYIHAERAVGKHVGIAVSLGYDVFYYNYSFAEQGNNGIFYRAKTDRVWVISPGMQLYYHFDKWIPVRNLDVFAGAGFVANYVKHSNYPSSDSSSRVVKPSVDPCIKVGARYYVNRHASFFLDAGYDKLSWVSLGFTYRFFGKILASK